jgi:hypothetical protein
MITPRRGMPLGQEPIARRERTVLDEAKGLVHGDRNESYGNPVHDFTRTAGMWTALFADYLKPGIEFKPQDVAKMMICVKLSRSMNAEKRDHPVDVAGYSETWDWTIEDVGRLRALKEGLLTAAAARSSPATRPTRRGRRGAPIAARRGRRRG